MDKISIIIPVYKAEKSISKCIESVISQTYSNWELLLIDDGSPDISGVICDGYASKDVRIKVFHVKNGGPSNARNIGLEKATGKYVCFIDSDDWVESTYLEHLYAGSHHNNTGVVVAGHIRDCVDIHIPRSLGSHYYDMRNMNRVFEERQLCVWGYTVAKLYQLDVIRENNIRFPEKVRFSEDLVLFLDYIRYCTWINFIPETDYHYIIPEKGGSLIVSYNSFESEYEGYKLCNKYFHELADMTKASCEDMKSSYEWMSYMFMRAIKTIYRKGKNYVSHRERMRILKSVPHSEYEFAKYYGEHRLFIDKLALNFCFLNLYLLADAILFVFFKLRYLAR